MRTNLDRWLAETADLLSNPEPPNDWTPPRPLRQPSEVGQLGGSQADSTGHHTATTGSTAANRQDKRASSEVGHAGGSQADPEVGHAGGSQADTDDSALDEQLDAEDAEDEDVDRRPAWSGYLEAAEDADELRAALAVVLHHCDAAERRQRRASGKRARTAASLKTHHAQLTATVCLAAKCLHRGVASFRVPMRDKVLKGARTRYSDPLLTPNLRTALQLLIAEEFIMQVESSTRPRSWRFDGQQCKQPGRQAGYAAGGRLAPLLGDVSLCDIRRAPGDEIILLKSKRDDFGMAELVDYKRTPAHVAEARHELVELNEFRAAANIECVGSPSRFDVSDRHTRRRWTRASWYCGGRHWGGFWQTMRKAERLNLIRIDGEPVVGIDYVGTIVTLAYASVGQTLPDGDPYGFELVDRAGAVVETTRKQRKTVFAAAMNGAKEWPRELRKLFRHRISWRRTVGCLSEAHPHIAVFFSADNGQALACTEANIMAAVLKRLRLQGVVALDMFDCVLVKQSAIEAAKAAMLEEFERIAGKPARVTVEKPDATPTETEGEPWDF